MTDQTDTQSTSQEQAASEQPLDLAALLAEANAKAEDYLDKYRRTAAEFSNYRKRIERERDQERLRIKSELYRAVLPVADDLQRALHTLDGSDAQAAWAEGVRLVERKMLKLLADAGVRPIAALGQPFDPNYHSAVLHQPSDEYAEGLVTEELQQGYLIDEAVLRPTLVKVSSGPGPRG